MIEPTPEAKTQSSTQWLTVSQAAASVGVSEKTVRKRIASGEIAAEKVRLSAGGWAWRVAAERLEAHRSATEAVGKRDGSFQPLPSGSFERKKTETAWKVPTASNRVTEPLGSAMEHEMAKVPSVPNEVPTAQNDTMTVALVSQLQSENAFLRAQVEAANRQAAEATAALREYLKMQARALPSGENIEQSSTRNEAAVSPINAPERAQVATADKQTQGVENSAQKAVRREMRPLWKVILGVR